MAGISAAEREIVETVRVQILGMDETEFITEDGGSIIVGGRDLVPGYYETIAEDMKARGATYVPQLVEHEGPAVGMVREVDQDDAGIWLTVDLWAEGVEARYGRDFVSAFWRFGDVGEDGRPRTAKIVENSFTPTPQFSLAQTPVSVLETMADELFPIAATMRAAVPPTQREPSIMTIEELIEMFRASDEFAELIREVVSAGAEEVEEAEAVDAEEEAAAMYGEAAPEDVEDVAASVVRALDAVATRLERVEKATAVAASLRGSVSSAHTGPKAGAAYLVERLEKGVPLDEAISENRNITRGA